MPFLKGIYSFDVSGYTQTINIVTVIIAIVGIVYSARKANLLSVKIEPFYVYCFLFCMFIVPFGMLNDSQATSETIGNYISAFYHFAFCIVAATVIKLDAKRTMRIWAIAFNIMALANVVTIVLFPNGQYSTGYGNHYTSYWLLGYDNAHINYYLMALLTTVLSLYMRRGKVLDWKVMLLWVVYTAASVDRWTVASLLSLLVLGFLLLFEKILSKVTAFNVKNYILAVLGISTLLLIMSALFNSGPLADFLSVVLQKDATFTGRSDIWRAFVGAIGGHPIFGYGYQSLSEMNAATGYSGAHNEWLQMLYEGGVLHFAFYALMLKEVVGKVSRCKDRRAAYLVSAFILASMIVQIMIPLRQICWMILLVIAYKCDVFVPSTASSTILSNAPCKKLEESSNSRRKGMVSP